MDQIFLKVYDENNPKLKLRIGKGAPDFPGMDKGYKLELFLLYWDLL